jgi:hypothetical protein
MASKPMTTEDTLIAQVAQMQKQIAGLQEEADRLWKLHGLPPLRRQKAIIENGRYDAKRQSGN